MGSRRICDECGAPVPDGKAFCDYCGAFVGIGDDDGDDSASEGSTERMPQVAPEVRKPIPLAEAKREGTGSQKRGVSPDRSESKGKSGSALPVVTVILALALAVAGLVGYVVGTSKPATRDDGNDSPSFPSASPVDGGESETKDEKTDSQTGKEPGEATKAEVEADSQPDDATARKETAEPVDDETKDDETEKPAEDEDQKRMREAIPKRIAIEAGGQIDVGLTVPDGDVSMRVEVEQGGRVVYGSRILAPGEHLGSVPADGAEEGPAKVVAYGVVGDADHGEPVTVDIEIARPSEG